MKKLLVGTLFCGESEFDACCAAIGSQKGVQTEHIVIRDMPELEAHNTLWQTWNDRRAVFDFFVKIDADTVLDGDDRLRRIVDLMSANQNITGAQIPLQDYFTDDAILGMNVFSSAVHFIPSVNGLFADRGAERGHRIVLRGDDVASVAPAGFHCLDPKPRQAFHFGYHRILKGQLDTLRKTGTAWSEKGGNGRMWALLGAWAALRQEVKQPDYGNPKFHKLMRKAETLPDKAGIAARFTRELEDLAHPGIVSRLRFALNRRYWRYHGLRR